MLLGVSLEAWAVDHREIGREIVKIRPFRAAQHVPDEKAVPGHFGHHADIDGMARVRPAHQILNEIVTALHMRQHVFVKGIKAFGRHRGVVVPPDRFSDAVGLDHMLVFGGTACEFAGADQKRTAVAQPAFAAA